MLGSSRPANRLATNREACFVAPSPELLFFSTPRQSRTTVYRLHARLIRRPSAKDPDYEYVANTAVDRHHRGWRYAPAGLIEYLDACGPVIPVALARHQATSAPPPAVGANQTGPASPRSWSLKPVLGD